MSTTRLTGLYAVIAAGLSVLFSPLLALAYFATADGAEALEIGTVSAWADPARDLAGGLLTWASPDRVYSTYLQVLALLFPAVLLCAHVVRARRAQANGRLERWGWRITLTGYALMTIGVAAVAVILIPGNPGSGAANAAFLALMAPGMLIGIIGSTVLGTALLRGHYTPRSTAWLLTLAFPLMLIGSAVLGHNSLGLVPLFLAWGATGAQLWRGKPTRAPSPALRQTS